jgi:hypothetical protein
VLPSRNFKFQSLSNDTLSFLHLTDSLRLLNSRSGLITIITSYISFSHARTTRNHWLSAKLRPLSVPLCSPSCLKTTWMKPHTYARRASSEAGYCHYKPLYNSVIRVGRIPFCIFVSSPRFVLSTTIKCGGYLSEVARGHPLSPLHTCRPEIKCFLVLVYSCGCDRQSWIDLALYHSRSYVAQAALHRAPCHPRPLRLKKRGRWASKSSTR